MYQTVSVWYRFRLGINLYAVGQNLKNMWKKEVDNRKKRPTEKTRSGNKQCSKWEFSESERIHFMIIICTL